MTRIERCRVRILLALGLGAVLLTGTVAGQAPKYPNYPERDARDGHGTSDDRLRLRPARRDDPDARRRQAAHRHPRAEGREATRRSC